MIGLDGQEQAAGPGFLMAPCCLPSSAMHAPCTAPNPRYRGWPLLDLFNETPHVRRMAGGIHSRCSSVDTACCSLWAVTYLPFLHLG